MEKVVFKILFIILFLQSCGIAEKPNVLYVKFKHDIEKYHFDGKVFKDNKPVGKVTNVKSYGSYLFYEIILDDKELKLRKGSIIELKSIDLLSSKKLIIKEGDGVGFYQSQDTLLGEITESELNLTNKNVDSVIKRIDPAIKELLQLDTNGNAK